MICHGSSRTVLTDKYVYECSNDLCIATQAMDTFLKKSSQTTSTPQIITASETEPLPTTQSLPTSETDNTEIIPFDTILETTEATTFVKTDPPTAKPIPSIVNPTTTKVSTFAQPSPTAKRNSGNDMKIFKHFYLALLFVIYWI